MFRIEMFNFHYDNIIMDYQFPELQPTDPFKEKDEEHHQKGNVMPNPTIGKKSEIEFTQLPKVLEPIQE